MRPSRLRRILGEVLKTSLVSTPLLPLGAAVAQAPAIDTSGFVQVSDDIDTLKGLSPSLKVDVIERRQLRHRHKEIQQHAEVTKGTPCATAKKKRKCRAAFKELKPEQGFGFECALPHGGCFSTYFAITSGDTVKALTRSEDLRSFLAPIDTGHEATLLVQTYGFKTGSQKKGGSGVRPASAGGFEVLATTGHTCGPDTALRRHLLHVSPEGEVRELSQDILEPGNPKCIVGRRPSGLVSLEGTSSSASIGRYLAAAAQLEAASVASFQKLARELECHGAPARLVRKAIRSAADEVRHAERTWEIAARFGATFAAPVIAPTPVRDLLEVALENRVEGCVRETYGALLAHHQAAYALEGELQALMQAIAGDETRHAALSWEVDEWVSSRLTGPEQEALQDAQRAAIAALRFEAAVPLAEEVHALAGMPRPAVAVTLVDELERALWS